MVYQSKSMTKVLLALWTRLGFYLPLHDACLWSKHECDAGNPKKHLFPADARLIYILTICMFSIRMRFENVSWTTTQSYVVRNYIYHYIYKFRHIYNIYPIYNTTLICQSVCLVDITWKRLKQCRHKVCE